MTVHTRSMTGYAFAALFLLAAMMLASIAGSDNTSEAQTAAGPKVDYRLTQQLENLSSGEKLRAIVTYDDKPTQAEVDAVRQLGLAVHTFDELPMVAVQGTKGQIEDLLSLEGPRSVYADRRLEYMLHESVPLIGADRVHQDLGYTGKGIGVAVLDTGIDGLHQDVRFPERTVQNAKILGDSFFTGTNVVAENVANTDTTSGHGTHVAGIVGGDGTESDGYYTGVAPGADLVGIGAGDTLFILYALEGFDYALEHQEKYDIQVISNSWGTSGEFDPEDPVNVASKEAYNRGITVTFAAGNAGPDEDTLNPYSVAPWVIGVAAGEKDGETLAEFSSRGRPGDPLYHPDITAPGVDIVSARASTGSTINALTARKDATYVPPEYIAHYTTASGTSMATPHVSGTIALMEEADPTLTPDKTLDILTRTATPMDYEEYQAGAGYLNAYDAVQAVARTSQGKAKSKAGTTR